MPPTTACSFGDVVHVPLPFTDQTGLAPSAVKPIITTIEKRLALRKLGQPADLRSLRENIRAILEISLL